MTIPYMAGSVSPNQNPGSGGGGGGNNNPNDNVISSLFTNNVKGAWYDPSDRSTMFKDFKNTKCEIGDPVALLLDKSRNLQLGPEKVTNGNFTNGTTGWVRGWQGNSTGSLETVANSLRINVTTSNVGDSYYAFQSLVSYGNGLEPFKLYKITFTVTNYVKGSIYWMLYNDLGTTMFYSSSGNQTPFKPALVNGNGDYTCYIPVFATNSNYSLTRSQQPVLNYFQIMVTGLTDLCVSNVSLKELYGNHAFAYSSTIRNTLDLIPNTCPRLSARVNLLTNTSSWSVNTSQDISVAAGLFAQTKKQMILKWQGGGTLQVSYLVGTTVTDTITNSSGNFYLSPLPQTEKIRVKSISGTVTNIDLRWVNSAESNIPPYQEVRSSFDYDSSNFPLYLQFNTDFTIPNKFDASFLLTNWSFFDTNTNKLTIWCGSTQTQTMQSDGPQLLTYQGLSQAALKNNFCTLAYAGIFLLNIDPIEVAPLIQGAVNSNNSAAAYWPSFIPDTSLTGAATRYIPQSYIMAFKYNYSDNSVNCLTSILNGKNGTLAAGRDIIYSPPMVGPVGRDTNLMLGAGYYSPEYGLSSIFVGKIYSLIIRGAESSTTEINNVGQYINNKMYGQFWINP